MELVKWTYEVIHMCLLSNKKSFFSIVIVSTIFALFTINIIKKIISISATRVVHIKSILSPQVGQYKPCRMGEKNVIKPMTMALPAVKRGE